MSGYAQRCVQHGRGPRSQAGRPAVLATDAGGSVTSLPLSAQMPAFSQGLRGPRLRTHVVSESATVLCKALSRYRLHSRCGASGPREHPLRPTGSTCRPSPAGLAEKPLCREKAPCAGAQACGLQTGLSHSRTRRARSPFNHMRPVGDLLRPRPETGR